MIDNFETQKQSEIKIPLEIRETEGKQTVEKPDIRYIERTFREALYEQNKAAALEKSRDADDGTAESKGLSEKERTKIQEETGWSKEIIEKIENMDQYEVLKEAGLTEDEVKGKECLVKKEIDLNYKDADGISNRERMERGLAPLDKDTGKKIELHHLGQKETSPLVELTEDEHRTGEYKDGQKNQSLWHDNAKETEVHGEGNDWDPERKEYWKTRLGQIEGGSK